MGDLEKVLFCSLFLSVAFAAAQDSENCPFIEVLSSYQDGAYFTYSGEDFKNLLNSGSENWHGKKVAIKTVDAAGEKVKGSAYFWERKSNGDPHFHGRWDPVSSMKWQKGDKIALASCTGKKGGLQNSGVNCWDGCSKEQGPCAFCGTGLCCRKGYKDTSNGCDGTLGIDEPHHVCVAQETTVGGATALTVTETGTTAVTGTPAATCVPYSENACRTSAKTSGLTFERAGSFTEKGCYAYKYGEYAQKVYYGNDGTKGQMMASLEAPKYRPNGYDCNSCNAAKYLIRCAIVNCDAADAAKLCPDKCGVSGGCSLDTDCPDVVNSYCGQIKFNGQGVCKAHSGYYSGN